MTTFSTVLALPSDDSGDELLQCACQDEKPERGLILPSDDDGQPSRIQAPRKRRRTTVNFPGPTRRDLVKATNVIPRKVSYLWAAEVPRHMRDMPPDDIMEVYSPPRILKVGVEEFNLRGEISADLETGWNFNKMDHRISLVMVVKARKPLVLILSPPCTMFSTLQNLKWYKTPVGIRHKKIEEAVLHLEFSCLLMELQLSQGRWVVFEHPWRALSWHSPSLRDISKHPGMKCLRIDMCTFGMRSPKSHVPLRKPTVIMTNLTELEQLLAKKTCPGNHQHMQIIGNDGGVQLSAWAQKYPRDFCVAVAGAAAAAARRARA